jgi:protein gp37
MNDTSIEWTDVTWNPLSGGCPPVSEGCKFCYARRLAERFRGKGNAFPNGFDLTIRPHKLDEPRHIKGKFVFVNSMGDLFSPEVPSVYRDEVFEVMAENDQNIYQVLTKRSDEMARYCSTRMIPDHIWLGVTVELPKHIDRIDHLRTIEGPAVRFLSIEPLLGHFYDLDLRNIQWVIVGGESGNHLRGGAHIERDLRDGIGIQAVRDLRDICEAWGVPFFFKQWGGPKGERRGSVLDGRLHKAFPVEVIR